jgi:prepilin peptidase CpaA
MNWVIYIACGFQVLLLLCVIVSDVVTRLIPNRICLAIATVGIARHLLIDPQLFAQSIAIAAILFLLLLLLFHCRWIGGGDVKLLGALAIGLSITQLIQLMMITALSGGLLALVHLMLRHLPRPHRAPSGSSLLRRIYVAERWRNIRHAPLPYGVAIAFGGIFTVLSHGV